MSPVDRSHLTRVTPQTFATVVANVRESSERHAENLTEYRAGHLIREGARCYLSLDWASGFAIYADGELVNLFSTVKGRGDALVAAAVRHGATRLDCYEGHLSRLYARHGFTVTRRAANYYGPGLPDVVWMERAVSAPIGDHDANRAAWDVAVATGRLTIITVH